MSFFLTFLGFNCSRNLKRSSAAGVIVELPARLCKSQSTVPPVEFCISSRTSELRPNNNVVCKTILSTSPLLDLECFSSDKWTKSLILRELELPADRDHQAERHELSSDKRYLKFGAMSKCSICDVDGVRVQNPKLCGDCQDWDDLQHISSCHEKQDKFAHLNPVLFCYKHNPWWPPMRKTNYSHPKDMKFRQLEDFTTSEDCMICKTVRDALLAQTTTDTRAKIAVWKPFVYDPCDDHRMISREAAEQRGMLPTSQKCVLTVIIATSPQKKRTGRSCRESSNWICVMKNGVTHCWLHPSGRGSR